MQIGETVQHLMTERGLSLEAVAELVRAQGPDAKNVRYQHIQQLIDNPNRRPRFLPELAWAFGMSVEEFLGRRFAVRDAAQPYSSPPVRSGPETMEDAFKLLKHIAAARDLQEEALLDPIMVYVAHEVVVHAQDRVTESNLIDFMQRFNARLKQQGNVDGTEQRAVKRTRGNDERAPRRAGK